MILKIIQVIYRKTFLEEIVVGGFDSLVHVKSTFSHLEIRRGEM